MTVQRMYPGAEYSPDAFLAAPMGVGDTTATLTTTAYLPAGPNIAVINDATNPEVVLYQTNSTGTNTLSGITRGLSLNGALGTAAAHDPGVAVYSGDTAFNKNGMMANIQYLFAQQAIGVQWDRSSVDTTALTLIDADGAAVSTLPFGSFDTHTTFAGIRRCILSPTGTATYGTNARGDGLTLDGSAGRVMVSIPKFWVKADSPATGVYRWWVSPTPRGGYEVHPAFRMRGGTERDVIFVSAYNANLQTRDFPVHSSPTYALHSRTGAQPVTGEGATKVMFFSGGGIHAPTLGETVTGFTSGETGIVADWTVQAGTWAAGDAAGVLYLRQVSGAFGAETLDGSVAGANFATGTATANVTLPITTARAYAQNVGPGWGLMNIWTWSAVVLLALVENQTFDFQSALGRGVCDLAAGTGFAGALNGADSADSAIAVNGTGSGTGTNGETPVVWRGIENLYGNVECFVDGIASTNAGKLARITPRSGTGDIANPMTVGEISIGAMPAYAGSITDLLWEPLARLLFLPKTAGGTAGTYLCDYYAYPFGTPHSVMANGGQNGWYGGDKAGPFATNFFYGPGDEAVALGARLEYVGPEGGSPTTAAVTPGGGGAPVTVRAAVIVTTPTQPPADVSTTTPNPPAVYPSTPTADPPTTVVPGAPFDLTTDDGAYTAFSSGVAYDPTANIADATVTLGFLDGGIGYAGGIQTRSLSGVSPATWFGKTALTHFFFKVAPWTGSVATLAEFDRWGDSPIPPGATVRGITLKIWGRWGLWFTQPHTCEDVVVKLILSPDDDGSAVGYSWTLSPTNLARPADLWQSPSETNDDRTVFLRIYGGPAELWGFTDAILNPQTLARGLAIELQFETTAVGAPGANRHQIVIKKVGIEITYEV